MEQIIKYAQDNNVPIVRPITLQMLLDRASEHGIKRILEIGTAIGYSGSQMLLKNLDATLTTIEKSEQMYNVAKSNFERLGLTDRVEQLKGDAKDVLKDLLSKGEKYDLVFLDGPKGQYIWYLPVISDLLNDGGTIFADDVLFRGLVKGNDWPEHRTRTLVLNLRKYLEEVNIPPFKSQLFEVEDGVCITTKGEK